jgi:hypothetical protein
MLNWGKKLQKELMRREICTGMDKEPQRRDVQGAHLREDS